MSGRKSIATPWIVLLLSAALYAQSNDDALSASVNDSVRAQMQEQHIPGVSLAVMRDGKIIKATGYGLANVELNVPVTPQMLFHPESPAKAFTATAGKPKRDWMNEYIHPDDQALVLRTIREAVLTTSMFELEHRVRRTDGTLGWTNSRAVPLLNVNGEIRE